MNAHEQAMQALTRALERKVWREDGWEVPAIDVQEALDALNSTEPVYEYGWAGDAQATTFYDTKEEAEEYMGNPKRFARVKAGTWEEVS